MKKPFRLVQCHFSCGHFLGQPTSGCLNNTRRRSRRDLQRICSAFEEMYRRKTSPQHAVNDLVHLQALRNAPDSKPRCIQMIRADSRFACTSPKTCCYRRSSPSWTTLAWSSPINTMTRSRLKPAMGNPSTRSGFKGCSDSPRRRSLNGRIYS